LDVLRAEASEEWVGKLLMSLSKANNFEMTLMFVDEKEKQFIADIVKALPT